MGDPGFLSAAIGVGMQSLVNTMIEWIKIAACCQKELDKLKDLLHLILFIYAETQIYADRIGSLPSSIDSWLIKLNDLLQKGSHFVEECTVPSRWYIIPRGKLTKKITRFASVLGEHLASTSLIAFVNQLHLHVNNRETLEQIRRELESLKQGISASGHYMLPSTSSAAPNTTYIEEALIVGQDSSFTRLWENDGTHSLPSEFRLNYDALAVLPVCGTALQLCFLRLAAISDEIIRTEIAIGYWIGQGFVTGPDSRRTGETYVNLLADQCLIEPLEKDDKGNVRLFRMPDDFHDVAHQIVEEEKRIFRTGRDSQDFSGDERLNALLKVRILRGKDLAVRDRWRSSSDPYVVVRLGHQKRKTRVIRQNLDPVWDEEFSLRTPQSQPLVLKLEVFDKDTFSKDDPMGIGEVNLNNLARAARMLRTSSSPSLAMMNTEGSCIKCVDGHIVQEVCLRLQNVESGELYLEIKTCFDQIN